MRTAVTRLVAPFSYPGYTLYWSNNLLTSAGVWMEMVAQGWLIVQLTDSPFLLGLVAGGQGIAQLSVGPFGGVIADLVDRRRLLMAVQVMRACTVALMAFLVWSETVHI